MGALKLEVPSDLRPMAYWLKQWGMWTKIGEGGSLSLIASLMLSADTTPRRPRDVFLATDDECGAVDALVGILKVESFSHYTWINAHYRNGIPLKVLAKEVGISEHKVVQILVSAEEKLLAIANRVKKVAEAT